MKVLHSWLQDYFDDPLPCAEELAELLTFHSFEIEGVEQVGDEWVIDVDVLANRGSDCLCHRGIACELATILEVPLKDPLALELPEAKPCTARIAIEANELVNRFSIAEVSGVSVGPSPEWLRTRLEALGQRSINSVVDATNFVMLALGQPLHAFDADKLSGDEKILCVRSAQPGESITTLTKDTYELTPETLLITDGNDTTPLAIAGIKGGAHAEVDAKTSNLILEAANFNYVSVRKTSQRLKLSTDASVRFQNQPSPELTRFALRDVVALILDIAGGTRAGEVDWYPTPLERLAVPVALAAINETLGTTLTESEVDAIFTQFAFTAKRTADGWSVTPPLERKDLTCSEDLIEEVGRIAGYRSLASLPLDEGRTEVAVHPLYALSERIRHLLVGAGFSEVMTYTLREKGAVELTNALASDKNFVRDSLTPGIEEALARNSYYAPLLGREDISVFEIGVVATGLTKDGFAQERTMLALGVSLTKKRKGVTADSVLAETLSLLSDELGVSLDAKAAQGVVEIDLSELVSKLPTPESYPAAPPQTGSYTPYSSYPFVLRDVAVWVPEGTTAGEVESTIREHAGMLLMRCDLFDEFSKESRTSFAFHLVFQAPDRTLTDEEVGASMDALTTVFARHAWEVR